MNRIILAKHLRRLAAERKKELARIDRTDPAKSVVRAELELDIEALEMAAKEIEEITSLATSLKWILALEK